MKPIKIINYVCTLIAGLLLFCAVPRAQDSTPGDLNINLRYFMFNNKISYVLVNTKTKMAGKFQPVRKIGLSVYLDSVAGSNLIGKVNTDTNGDAQLLIPGSLRSAWDASASHKFLAVSVANKQFAETSADIEIIKAKIVLDTTTVDTIKSITAKVFEFKDNDWTPAPDVELKIGVRRLGGMLPIGKEATYTTDSTGEVTAEFTKLNLPAEKGILTLVVNAEDNDKYGNLVYEQKIPWGVPIVQSDDWNKRTLYSTRFRSPIWLLFMAYSVMAAVWGVLLYLVMQIIKLRKLGKKVAVDNFSMP